MQKNFSWRNRWSGAASFTPRENNSKRKKVWRAEGRCRKQTSNFVFSVDKLWISLLPGYIIPTKRSSFKEGQMERTYRDQV